MSACKNLLLFWIAAAALGSCKDTEKHSEHEGQATPATQGDQGHRAGLANARAMIENAELCEPKTGVGNVQACETACELNHSNSCANWAAFLQSSDLQRARLLYQRSCKGGSGIGCEAEARLTREAGEPHSDQIYLNARRYHRVHCSQGYGRSCSQLASLFENGLGGDADKITGQSYRARACLLGVASDC